MMRDDTLVPRVTTYSAAIIACEKAQGRHRALALAVVMHEARRLPHVINGNAAISVGGKVQYWHHALGLTPGSAGGTRASSRSTYCAATKA